MNENIIIIILIIVILIINLYFYNLINKIEENFDNIYTYKGPYSISNQYTIFKNKFNNQVNNYHKNIEFKIFKPINDKIMYYYNKYI